MSKRKRHFRSSAAPTKAASLLWASLLPDEQRLAARRLGAAALALAADAHGKRVSFGKGYEAVSEPFASQRRKAVVELKSEDHQLNARQRNQLINMHRDMLRNSPARVTQDQQIRINVVGTVGGKCYANFPAEFRESAGKLMKLFNKRFFAHAEFTYRKDFNWVLETCLTSQDANGAVILVFDDGIITGGNGTGRIRGFEGDEIANVPQDFLEKTFGKGFSQSHGLVYDSLGVWCGAFVSSTQRGKTVFSPDAGVFVLRFDPYDDEAVPNWIMLGDMSRFNQGKPISQLTSALTCLVDLHETIASEAQSTKLNSKLVGQILSSGSEADDPTGGRPMGFSDAANPSVGSDRDVGELPQKQEFTLKELEAIGAVFNQLPEGWKIDLLDTKRPNPNLGQYLDLLMGLVGGTKGLARVYATLKAQTSYTAFRGEQIMTWPSFKKMSKNLERHVCDWSIRCVVSRYRRIGLVDFNLPDDWPDYIAWNWPKMPEVSRKDAAAALAQELKNGTTSLTRELSPGEYARLVEERAREAADAKAAGLVYPGSETVSGQMVSGEGEEESSGSSSASPDDGEEESSSSGSSPASTDDGDI